MSNETFSFTAGMHREWVAFLNGQQIASVYGIGKFEKALRSGDLRSGDETGKVRALYVITEKDGTLRAACAFTIYRNEQGELQRELKLPIRELAEQGGEGPGPRVRRDPPRALGQLPDALACKPSLGRRGSRRRHLSPRHSKPASRSDRGAEPRPPGRIRSARNASLRPGSAGGTPAHGRPARCPARQTPRGGFRAAARDRPIASPTQQHEVDGRLIRREPTETALGP